MATKIRYRTRIIERAEVVSNHIRVRLSPQPRELEMRQWEVPPHVALANLNVEDAYNDPEIVIQFMQLYGPFGVSDNWHTSDNWYPVDVSDIEGMQRSLRTEWEGQRDELGDMLSGLSADAELEFGPQGVDIVATDLWTLIRILFFQDKAAGRIAVCPVRDRRTPYFVRERQGQEFCSHECAVLMANRRYRQAQTKEAISKWAKLGGRSKKQRTEGKRNGISTR